MFFSIIIPVYNAEKTLEKCLNSLYAQTFGDFEVLLTDDGSQDRSFSICEAFAAKDLRFKPVHQENRGPSGARNEALNRAEGDYLCFVDSDDFVTPEYLSRLHDQIGKTGADALFFGYCKADPEGKIIDTRVPTVSSKGKALLAELSAKDMFGYTWIKCFSRGIVGETRFPEDMQLFEDEVFACSVLEKTENIAVISEALYCYVCGGTNMLTGKTFSDYCKLSDRVFSAWEHLMRHTPERETVLERKANAFVDRCRYYGLERDVEAGSFFGSLAETRFFRLHTNRTALDRLIQNRSWLGIRMTILLYRLKNTIRGVD